MHFSRSSSCLSCCSRQDYSSHTELYMLNSRHDYTPVLQPADSPRRLAQAALAFGAALSSHRLTSYQWYDVAGGTSAGSGVCWPADFPWRLAEAGLAFLAALGSLGQHGKHWLRAACPSLHQAMLHSPAHARPLR